MEITVIVLVIAFALLFDVTNGRSDAANSIATVVSTRVLRPWQAVIFGAGLNFAGAFYSSEVAKTVGRDIADPQQITTVTFLAAVMVAPVWITICTMRGLPISCSHSLMGGLVGSVLASAGASALQGKGLQKIVFGVLTAPLIGFVLGYILLLLVAWIFRRVRASTASPFFGKLQIVSAGVMAFAHGTGDAQKAMGIITGALVAGKFIRLGADQQMVIPFWVRIACAVAMALGTALGGWAVIRTLGSKLAHLKPYQGFAAETAASTTIMVNTLTGIPISTTHSITGAILGVGAARGIRAVKWGVGKKIVFAWVFTFPVCIIGGAVIRWLLKVCGLG